MNTIIASVFVFFLGLSVGSFLNVCIYRLPRGESIVNPPSRCPSCNARLGVLELVPILGYALSRGRCRHCGVRISVQYPLVEAATAAVFVALFLKFPSTVTVLSYMTLCSALIALAVIDLNSMEVPDSVTVGAGALGAFFSFLKGELAGSLLGAAFGFSVLFLLARLARIVYGREAMGDGDAMIAAMIGAYTGMAGVSVSLLAAFLTGGLAGMFMLISGLKKLGQEVPFGPMIAAGAFVYIFFGEELTRWYALLFRV